jgi:hypothetical protein
VTRTVYALLIGIDCYRSPEVGDLRGAGSDIAAVSEFLQARVTDPLQTRVLLDQAATRSRIVAAFGEHLGPADAAGDVALIWFSGHGSEQPVAEEFRWLEPSGMNQTLVCHDSRVDGVPDLTDKELFLLLGEIARRGAHVVAVLDNCHSGGGTREVNVAFRGAPRAAAAPTPDQYIPQLRALRDTEARPPQPVHIELAACQPHEKAAEQPIDGVVRGVFSTALLTALRTMPAGATYRELLTAARCRVQNMAGTQAPELFPVELGGPVDQPFLGGATSRPASGFTLRQLHSVWEVDAGSCHGMPVPADDEPLLLTVPGSDGTTEPAGGRLLQVTDVGPAVSHVQPLDWSPDPDRPYPVLLAEVPLPPAAVVLGGLPEDDADALALVQEAIEHAGPGGGPSPRVRVVPVTASAAGLRLRVAAVEGRYRLLRGDGSAATADVPGHTRDSARLVLARLEHIAQWTLLHELENTGSALAGAVTMEFVAAPPGQLRLPPEAAALVPDRTGAYRLGYEQDGPGWRPPAVFIRLHNTSGQRLWCAVLDLTDRFRIHSKLLPGAWVGDGELAAAYEGKRIPVTLPPGREVRSGARGQDWIKLVASTEQFNTAAFDLPRLDEPVTRSGARARARGIVDRLALRVRTRDAGDSDISQAADWTTSMAPIVVEVPAADTQLRPDP